MLVENCWHSKFRLLFQVEELWKLRWFRKMPPNFCYSWQGRKKERKKKKKSETSVFTFFAWLGTECKSKRTESIFPLIRGHDWIIWDKQMQTMANHKVKPLPKQFGPVWELELWYCFCHPAHNSYESILFCTVLGWFVTLWPWMVQMHSHLFSTLLS